MRLAALEVVLAVARLRSFAAAARELGYSTTAVSRTVATLEAQLGARLFQRTTRSTAVTPAGLRLVAELGAPLAAVEHALARTRGAGEVRSGTLRINTSLQGAVHVAPLLETFLDENPGVEIELSTERRMIDIVRAGFDAGIRSRDAVPADMVRVPIGGAIAFVIVGAPAYLDRRGTPSSLRALGEHRCIRYRSGTTEHRWEVRQGGRDVTIQVHGPLAVDDHHVAHRAALAGLGLALLPRWVVARDLEEGRLRQVLRAATPESPQLCLYHPAGRNPPPLIRALVRYLRWRS